MYTLRLTIITLFTLLLSACSNQHTIKPKTLNHQNQEDVINYLSSIHLKAIGKDKTYSFDEFIDKIIQSRAIFVGETHDRYDNHLVQFAVLKALYQKNPNIAIGVEWFQQPYQWVVNRYLNGTINEKQLLKKSEYYKRWQYRYAMLRPILIYSKQHKIPVIALNAPSELTKKVGKSGLSSLSHQERQQLPKIIHPPTKAYRKRLEKIFKQHITDKKRLENFITVQRIWDETMAMNAAKFLKKHPQHKIIVFAGNGHISNNVSIPSDIKHYLTTTTVTISSGNSKEKPEPNTVDYFVINEAVSLPKSGRMGIMLGAKDNHVFIKGLIKESAAEKAGLQKNDQIIGINGKQINNLTDLKQILDKTKPKEQINLKVFRANAINKKLSVKLILM